VQGARGGQSGRRRRARRSLFEHGTYGSEAPYRGTESPLTKVDPVLVVRINATLEHAAQVQSHLFQSRHSAFRTETDNLFVYVLVDVDNETRLFTLEVRSNPPVSGVVDSRRGRAKTTFSMVGLIVCESVCQIGVFLPVKGHCYSKVTLKSIRMREGRDSSQPSSSLRRFSNAASKSVTP